MFHLTSLAAAATSALLLLSHTAQAAVTPTSPESATTVRIGQPLTALWAADTTGQWTDMTVQLMTGDNLNMVPLTTLSTGIDGTKETSHSWTTPNVSPTSKIYFLQFTRGGDVSTAQWTTRFTIASADGSTSTPTNSTTYSAAQGPIQWGTGMIVGGSNNATTLPSAISSAGASSGGVATGGVPTISVPASASSASTAAASAASSISSTRSAASSASSAGAAAASSSRAAAGRLEVGGLAGLMAGLVGVALL